MHTYTTLNPITAEYTFSSTPGTSPEQYKVFLIVMTTKQSFQVVFYIWQ